MPGGELLKQILERRDLSQAQAEELLEALTDPQLPAAMAGALLTALAMKGVVADEVRGFALRMRRLAHRPDLPASLRALDVVGTGGGPPPGTRTPPRTPAPLPPLAPPLLPPPHPPSSLTPPLSPH